MPLEGTTELSDVLGTFGQRWGKEAELVNKDLFQGGGCGGVTDST